jgi:phage-related protein
MHHVASDAVVILDVFAKKTEATPAGVLDTCRKRLADYLKVVTAKERR